MLYEKYQEDDAVISSLQERLFEAQESGDASQFNFDLFRLELNSLSSQSGSAHLDANVVKSSTMLLDDKIGSYMEKYGFTPGNMVEVLDQHIADVKSSGASYSYRGRKFFLDLGAMSATRKSLAMAIQRNARQFKQLGGALDSDSESFSLLMSGKQQRAGPGGDSVGQLRTLERDLDAMLASLSSWYLKQGGLNINRLVEAANAPQDDDCVSDSNGGGCSILEYEFEPSSLDIYESRYGLEDADQMGETETQDQDEGLNEDPNAAEMLNQPIGGADRFPDARAEFMGNFVDSLENSFNFKDSLERSFEKNMDDGDAEPEDER